MFGSWNEALREAGLNVNVITNPTEERCLETLIHLTDDLGKSPTVEEYDEHRRDTDLSPDTIRSLFGSWNEAKRAADILAYHDGNGVNYPYGPTWSSQREAALTRDGECQDCGLSNEEHRNITGRSLDVHHLFKLRRFYDSLSDEDVNRLASDERVPAWLEDEMRRRTERANDLSNLVSLCRECHVDIERFSVNEQATRLGIDEPSVSPEGVRTQGGAQKTKHKQNLIKFAEKPTLDW